MIQLWQINDQYYYIELLFNKPVLLRLLQVPHRCSNEPLCIAGVSFCRLDVIAVTQ